MIPKNGPPFGGGVLQRPPHRATVAQPKRRIDVPPTRQPHAATVAQRRPSLCGPAKPPPHPATRARPGAVLQRMEQKEDEDDKLDEVIDSQIKDVGLGALSESERKLLRAAYSKGELWDVVGRVFSDRELSSLASPEKPTETGIIESTTTGFLDDLASKEEQTLFEHAHGTSDASKVRCFVSYSPGVLGGAIKPDEKDAYDFALLGQSGKKETEISVSSGDGEVLVLSAALRKLQQDKQGKIEVVLCGPYGACDGCKMRIARFIQLWQESAKAGQTLTVHYVYASPFNQTRGDIPTIYGDWNDAFKAYGVKQVKEKKKLYVHTWKATA